MSAFFVLVANNFLNLQQIITTMAKKKHTPDLLEDKEYHDFLEDAFQTAKSQMTQQEIDMLEENGIIDLDSFLDSMLDVGIDRETMMQALANAAIAGEDGYENVPVSPLDDPDWFDSYATSITKVFHDPKPQEFHLRIKLNNAPVKIWREFKVPSNLSLEALAFLLESVMGWNGSHLHQFRCKDTYYKSPGDIEYIEDLGFPKRYLEFDANDFHLGNVFHVKSDRILFEYDFGDSWEHDVWLKGIRDYNPDETPKLILVKGEGDCPPDDCGGVWGYEDMLRVIAKKRKTKEEKEMLEWYGIDQSFDPNDYNFEDEAEYMECIWEELMDLAEEKTS